MLRMEAERKRQQEIAEELRKREQEKEAVEQKRRQEIIEQAEKLEALIKPHEDRAKELEALGKIPGAIIEYKKIYEINKDPRLLEKIKELRESTLGL